MNISDSSFSDIFWRCSSLIRRFSMPSAGRLVSAKGRASDSTAGEGMVGWAPSSTVISLRSSSEVAKESKDIGRGSLSKGNCIARETGEA